MSALLELYKSLTDDRSSYGGFFMLTEAQRTSYEPRNFKPGDKVICIKAGDNKFTGEKIELHEQYEVELYQNGNAFVKAQVILKGCKTIWSDDRFELPKEEWAECEDVTHVLETKKALPQ